MAVLDSTDLDAIAARLLVSPANKIATDASNRVSADMTAISGEVTAADNLASQILGGALNANVVEWGAAEVEAFNDAGGPWAPMIQADTVDATIASGATTFDTSTQILVSAPKVGDVIHFATAGQPEAGQSYLITGVSGTTVTVSPAFQQQIDVNSEWHQFRAPPAVLALAQVFNNTGTWTGNITGSVGVVTSLGGSNITYNGPVADNGDVTLYAGDDYTGAQSLPWTITGWAGASVHGENVTLGLMRKARYDSPGNGPTDLEITTGTATQSGTTVSILVPVTSVQTLTLLTSPPLDEEHYQLQIRSNTTKQRLVDAACTVRKNALST